MRYADAAYARVSAGRIGAGDRESYGKQPPKRQRELVEAKLLESTGMDDTTPAGKLGVGMEISRDQQVQGEEGYKTVHFTNNSSTRYVCWPYHASAYAKP
jgi:hypothetical protein